VENLAKYCGKFLKSGFGFGGDVKEVLSKKFEEEPDVRVCAHALLILKETQVFDIEDYKGWYYKVGSRFSPETLEEAMKAPHHATADSLEQTAQVKLLSKHRMLELILGAKRGDDDWRSKAEDWILETRERYKESFESLEKEWIEWRQSRLRKSPRTDGTIEVICNGPTTKKWRIFGFRCMAPYRPDVLWTEIQSWLKDCGEVLDDLDYCHVWDEKGRVDPTIQRDPIDG
jgi:hypothetical protein